MELPKPMHNFYIKTAQISGNFKQYKYAGNYPEIFSNEVKVDFKIHIASSVKLIIYDVFGRKLYSMPSKDLKSGSYEFKWDANKFEDGVYYCKIFYEDLIESKKIMLIKNVN